MIFDISEKEVFGLAYLIFNVNMTVNEHDDNYTIESPFFHFQQLQLLFSIHLPLLQN